LDPSMMIDLVMVKAPKPPGSRTSISPFAAVFEMAPAKVLHGAVRLHGLASSPTPDTQVRVACAAAGDAAPTIPANTPIATPHHPPDRTSPTHPHPLLLLLCWRADTRSAASSAAANYGPGEGLSNPASIHQPIRDGFRADGGVAMEAGDVAALDGVALSGPEA